MGEEETPFQSYLTGIEIKPRMIGKRLGKEFQSYLTGIEIPEAS